MSTKDALDILSTYGLPELVYQTVTFLNIPLGSLETDDSAVAASYSLRKIEPYLSAVQQAEDRRGEIGLEVRAELEAATARLADDPDEAEHLRQAALQRMGDYEMQQHMFTVCVGQIRRLLPLVHRIIGVEMDPNDVAYLDTYQPLRNQFEHLDERLPGQEKGGRLVLDVPGRLLVGLNDDGAGNITVRRGTEDIVAAVNQPGVEVLHAIVGRSFDAIRAKCIEHLEQFFDANPELTTDLSWLHPTFAQRLKDDVGNYL